MTIDPALVTTYEVNLAAAAGSTAIMTPPASHRWVVVGGQLTPAAANGTFQALSGATAITGVIVLPAAGLTLTGDPVVWAARAAGEALNIDPAAQDLDGWLNVMVLK
jgi:hypothetical protein